MRLNYKDFGGETVSDLVFTKIILAAMLRIDSKRKRGNGSRER